MSLAGILFAVSIPMSGVHADRGRCAYDLDISGIPDNGDVVWTNGESPLPGWQAYDAAAPVAKLAHQNQFTAPVGGLYLWNVDGFRAIGMRSASQRTMYLGCIFRNDFGLDVRGVSVVTQVVQVGAPNTGFDGGKLEYAISPDISTIVDNAEWRQLYVFSSMVVKGFAEGELPDYGSVRTNALPRLPDGCRLAFRWVDMSPSSGGNALFAYPVFRLEFTDPNGTSIYLR